MSNTSISPSGAAPLILLAGAVLQSQSTGPVTSAAQNGLGNGAIGSTIAMPSNLRQAKFAFSGTTGANFGANLQGSVDGNTWTTIAGINSLTAPGFTPAPSLAGGYTTLAPGGGLLYVVVTSAWADPWRFLRVAVQGDSTTAIGYAGQFSAAGCI